ncbi:hypothetical protein [Geobacillus sp. ZGt-1]|uniref:hypothetical protein n=1 Tax=Geobacillus sp. ZGt-1 TaxID=1631556 RepID=UPI0003F4BA08|nr:hypothetical protein [Geobacillus sp. ZGt-1]
MSHTNNPVSYLFSAASRFSFPFRQIFSKRSFRPLARKVGWLDHPLPAPQPAVWTKIHQSGASRRCASVYYISARKRKFHFFLDDLMQQMTALSKQGLLYTPYYSTPSQKNPAFLPND